MFVDINDKHMFALRNDCEIKETKELEDDRPRNNEGGVRYYITIDMDLAKELDSSKITPMPIESKHQPIYATLEDITTIKGEQYNPTKAD